MEQLENWNVRFMQIMEKEMKDPLKTEKGQWDNGRNGHYDINLSDIDSYLIQQVGRFVERYNSDFLITRFGVQKRIIETKTFEPQTVFFGLRRNGVDGNAFLCARLEQLATNNGFPEHIYRKIYAMKCTRTDDGTSSELQISLYDITNMNWLTIKRQLPIKNE